MTRFAIARVLRRFVRDPRWAVPWVILAGMICGVGLAQILVTALTPERLTVKVFPWVCQPRCTIRVTVQVDPQEDNRSLQVTVQGAEYESSSTLQVNGADAPYTLPFFWFRELPSGEYRVEGFLHTRGGHVFRQQRMVKVN